MAAANRGFMNMLEFLQVQLFIFSGINLFLKSCGKFSTFNKVYRLKKIVQVNPHFF
jgi:hypothetical protein